MDVYVPTPSGAGRKIAPGKCIEGNFFSNLLTTRHFKQVELSEIKEEDIICNYNVVTSELTEDRFAALHIKVVPPVIVPVPETIPVGLTEEPKEVKTLEVSPATTSFDADITEDTVDVIRPDKEVNKFNLTELKITASGMGISYDDKTTRRQLINSIIAKGYNG